MQIVNIHEAKTQLSRLVDRAAKGEPFIIAKAGKSLVQVLPLTVDPSSPHRRVGFLVGYFTAPEDFDSMGSEQIEAMFKGMDTA